MTTSCEAKNDSVSINEDISYINSTHEKRQLLFDGARFCIKQKNLNSILWRCIKDNCGASVTISKDDVILRKNNAHNHLTDSNDIKILELRQKLKQEAQTTSTPIDKIVEIAYANMIIERKKKDSISKYPSVKTLKNTVSKQRRKVRPSLPKCIEDLPFPLPTLYTLTKHNENFILHDGKIGKQRGLIFASDADIKYLSKQEFCIHTYDDGLASPCVFALLSDKKEETYRDFFSILMKKIMEICNDIRLKSITIDYELSVKNVFYKYYPHVEVKGCLFHYGQALFRKFVDLNLKTPFQNDDALRIWFRSFAAIALLPKKDMNNAIEHLRLSKFPLYDEKLQLFLKYHDETYGINSNFPPVMYNHYRNINPRTINYLEGRHNRWKKRSTKPHHDIYACIDMFKLEQFLSADERLRDEEGASPPKRKKATRIAEESLGRLWDKLEKNKIDIETFLKGAGLRYFQYLKIE